VWTTFSQDQVDLNFKNPEVLLAVVEALLFYVQQGAKFIRLDAIAFLWKEPGTTCLHLPQTHAIIQIFRAVLDQSAPDVRLITETNVPHSDNISYFGDGMNEAQLVYNFALAPLVLHSFQKANAAHLTDWARTLSTPSTATTFFNFLASHDGIGVNPVRGILSEAEIEDLVAGTVRAGGMVSYKSVAHGPDVPYELNINFLDALAPAQPGADCCQAVSKFMTAQAIMLSLQGVPGIYFHSLFGSRGDLEGARASGIKRRVNREKLDRSKLEAELADKASLRSQVFAQYADLLRFRRRHRAFAPNAPQQVLALDPRVFAILRESLDQSEQVLCLHNLSGDTVHVQSETTGGVTLAPFAWKWVEQPRPHAGV
ncbi:MAG TPA: alpha-amylase family glycosyl hydrolase, partial [Clostridia bacterium]|nr:alpha-amylase family glycosyl hydrolase [Clostridia bacterium]